MARPTPRKGNLPTEVTSFVGRRREVAEVRQKLIESRLVDLVGPGGVGKTRLAIRAATNLGRAFKDGVWLVELAELGDPTLVANTFMGALGLRAHSVTEPLSILLTYLVDKQLLLLVDNCEHLIEAAVRVISEVMTRAPGVRVIATSREALSIRGESVVPVAPLELPPQGGAEPLNRLRHNEAVTLFVERAVAASGRFELTEVNRTAVAEVCRRLDGLPLAIELAAARTRILTAEQILERLRDRFAVLVGGSRDAVPRQQTLMTTVDWSHDLLGAGEQALFRRLAVFAGRFTLDDVEGVCGANEELGLSVLEALSSLVDKSIVLRSDAGSVACYRMHESMHEYARIKLEDAGEAEHFADRCAAYYLSRCRRAPQDSSRLYEWLEMIDLELDNIRLVLSSAVLRKDFVTGVDLAVSLGWYWITRATAEGVRWLDQLLASTVAHPALAVAYLVRGYLAVLQDDAATARLALDKAVMQARSAGQPAVISPALSLASIAESMAGNHAAAARFLDESKQLIEGSDDLAARLTFVQARSLNAFFEGDLDSVRSAASEGVRLAREVGADSTLDLMLINLGFAALSAGDLPGAKSNFSDALAVARRIDDRVAQCYALGGFVCEAAASGRPRVSARLLGAVNSMRAQTGAHFNAVFAKTLTDAEEFVSTALGLPKFRAEVDAGKAMSREAAFELALDGASKVQPRTDDPNPQHLPRRQQQVASLVAEGLSNKQIGARLFISEYTVDSHIRSIMNKLGLNSRAQIATWIALSPQVRT